MNREYYGVRDVYGVVHLGEFERSPLTLVCRGRGPRPPMSGDANAYTTTFPTCLWCAVLRDRWMV